MFFPVSPFLGYAWNLGSMLGLLLFFQVFSGLLLSLYYVADSSMAFDSVQYIVREANFGWLFRLVHFNGASIIFLCLYLHFFKALFISSHRLFKVWASGFFLLFIIMGIAFTGYVLVWSQMSYWACVVITSLFSTFPFFGSDIVIWIWGGYSVCNSTLKFIFVLHFILPWTLLVLVLLHMVCLHEVGSSTVLGYTGDLFKVSFFPYYWAKDLINLIPLSLILFFTLSWPYLLGDPEMFIEANPLLSPVHIVPEWYFLLFFAILRSIPIKGIGVLFLLGSLVLPLTLCFLCSYYSPLTLLVRFLVYCFIFNVFYLSWLGQCDLSSPFIWLGVVSTVLYFSSVLLLGLSHILGWVLYIPF